MNMAYARRENENDRRSGYDRRGAIRVVGGRRLDDKDEIDWQEARLLLIQCRNELRRWARLDHGMVLIGPEDADTSRALIAKVDRFLGLEGGR